MSDETHDENQENDVAEETEATESEATETEATESEATEAEATEPETAAEASEPEAEEPEAEEPEAEEPEAEEPEEPEPAKSEAAEPAAKADESASHDDDDAEDVVPKRPSLLLAEYETPGELMKAAEKVRDAGYEKWDCYTPYPVHGMDDAMGLPPTRIGLISFIGGMTGLIGAFLMIFYMNHWDYPINIGGKPTGWGAFPSMVPVLFECAILLSGLSTLLGILGLNKLPRHNHPVFESERFERSTDDRFFLSIDVQDKKYDRADTLSLLKSTEPSYIELVEEEVF